MFNIAVSSPEWTWPVVAGVLALIAVVFWRRVLTLRDRLHAAEAECRETEARVTAGEKEVERVSAALNQQVAALGRALQNERRLFDAGPVTMFRWQAREGWPVEYVSPNVVQLFGWADQDFMTGRVRYASVVHAEDIERVAREVGAHSQGAASFFEQDYRIVRKDGATRWLYDITLIERDANGAITHYVGYVLDRTERVHVEQRLQRSQRLESLGVLAGGIAHDFNNLLVGILGNAALARERLPAGDPSVELVEAVEHAARRAGDLTNQMLAYAGKANIAVHPIDLSALIGEMADLVHASISKKATLEFHTSTPVPPIVGDSAQLGQVAMNLITNASDALGERSGRIVVATGVVELVEADFARVVGAPSLVPGSYAYLEVTDDGCGMDAMTQARMFEPFFTTKFAGRGLGLAAVLGIVRGHHGAIEVESSPGRGSRVRVYLPLGAAARPAARDASAPPPTPGEPVLRATTILIVDDEPAVQALAARVVRGRGLEALVAGDGEQALALLAEHGGDIGCVLLDLTMPKLSGAETFKALRARSPKLPVVITSGYSESDALESVDGAPATYFLHKPFTPAELVERLALALSAN
ncbi:MAG: response regulator [Planctomycetes bacterium]|nr:response regulator [Planctomycetota bacterium]